MSFLRRYSICYRLRQTEIAEADRARALVLALTRRYRRQRRSSPSPPLAPTYPTMVLFYIYEGLHLLEHAHSRSRTPGGRTRSLVIICWQNDLWHSMLVLGSQDMGGTYEYI